MTARSGARRRIFIIGVHGPEAVVPLRRLPRHARRRYPIVGLIAAALAGALIGILVAI